MALNPETLRNELVWRWRHFAVFSGPEWHRVLNTAKCRQRHTSSLRSVSGLSAM